MADNFNISTTQGQANEAGALENDNPAMTYVDFANQIARNSQQQQAQEQAIAQAKLLTGQKQAAADMGINPELKDFLPINEAVGEMQAAGIPQDQIDAFVKMLGGQKVVSRAAVDTVIRKKELLTKLTKMSEPFQATEKGNYPTSLDGSGEADLNDGQWYQAVVDTDGNISYVPSGQAPGSGMSMKMQEQDKQFWTRQFATNVANKVNPFLASSRTQVGVALQSYIRALRALEALSKTPLSKSDSINLLAEIGAIYKGGSPDQAQVLETQYNTLQGYFNQYLQTFFGKVHNFVPEDIRQHIVDRVTDLEKTSRQVIENAIQTTAALNGEIISHNQDQWDKFIQYIDKALADPNAAKETGEGYAKTTSTDLSNKKAPATPATPKTSEVGAAAAPGATQTKSGISYSVEE